MGFLARFRSAVATLTDRGAFAVVSEREDPKYFGNAVLVLEGQGVRVRFVADRSEVFTEMMPTDASKWWALGDVMTALGVPGGAAGPWESVEAAATALEKNLPSIVRAVADKDARLAGLREYS